MLRDTARESERARQPLDRVIDAVRESGLFALMVPRRYGGHEADIDTFFEVVLTLAQGDTSAAWCIGFYIEHNWWFLNYPNSVQDTIFADQDHVLAPAALSMGGGTAQSVPGGYRLSGQWQWGTGIVHASWVIAGALLQRPETSPIPMFFALPRSEVEMIDTWHMSGMCGTGSHDFRIDDVFVPENRALTFADMAQLNTGIKENHTAQLYRTPMLVILGFAAALPVLGAAKRAVTEFCEQAQHKYDLNTLKRQSQNLSRQALAGQAALEVESAELIMRAVLDEVMRLRDDADRTVRAGWLARITHSVMLSREAVGRLCAAAGASANHLDNPLQQILRDVNTASCHAIFDRDTRYRDFGATLVGLDPSSPML